MSWLTVAAVALMCFALRAGAPLLLRGRPLPTGVRIRLEAAVTPVLAALVLVQLLAPGGRLGLDPRLAGAGAGVALFAWRRSLAGALLVACAVTALARLWL